LRYTGINDEYEGGGKMELGMTDSQFKAYIRFFIKDLEDLKETVQEEEKEQSIKKLNKLLQTLQTTLED